MHDWSRVKAGTFHNFHFLWIAAIMNRLNAGLLPPNYFAMAKQDTAQPESDTAPLPSEIGRYASKANRITIHRSLEQVVAVVEIVSPGNKDRQRSLGTFVDKVVDLLQQKVNLLIIDPFPPGLYDPQGIHGAIWEEFAELPPNKPLTLAAYQVEPIKTAYVETIAVGDPLPDMPLFLFDELYVNVPLEETYLATWSALPMEIQRLFE